MKRILLIVCLVSILLVSCGRGEERAGMVLERLMAEQIDLPDGQVYLHSAEEGMPSYLTPSLRRSLYGERGEEILALVSDFAIFLSSRPMPCEIAVFQCYSRTDAHLVAAMCMERADAIRVVIDKTAFEEREEHVRVTVSKRTVIMTVTPDAEGNLREWR